MNRSAAAGSIAPLPTLSERHIDPHSYPDGIAFLDGQYLPMSQAKISVLDWGFLHSDATYDTVHVWTAASSASTCISTASSEDWRNCA